MSGGRQQSHDALLARGRGPVVVPGVDREHCRRWAIIIKDASSKRNMFARGQGGKVRQQRALSCSRRKALLMRPLIKKTPARDGSVLSVAVRAWTVALN